VHAEAAAVAQVTQRGDRIVKTDVEARVPYSWEDRKPVLELDFPAAEFEERIRAVQHALAQRGADALAVYGGASQESNVRYLSGFGSWWGDALVMVPRRGDPVLITNSIFHGEPMHSNLQTTWIQDLRPLLNPHSTGTPKSVVEAGRDVLGEWGALTGTVAFVDLDQAPSRITRELSACWPQVHVHDGAPILAGLRRIKSPAEIDLVRRLGRIASAGMDAGMAAVRPGVTESEVAAAVHAGCIGAGAERMGYGVLASAGQRSHMKNIFPRPDKRIRENELVVIDLGCQLGGYRSDMSRNIVAGEPPMELRRLLDACLDAEDAGIRHTRPGVSVVSVVTVMNDVIRRHGSEAWDWSTGHGFGLDTVEEPFFHPTNTAVLEPGMCFYIEPMIVPPTVGTICFEDMVVVTEDGCEVVTTSKRRMW